jgi:hypothetical protein
MNNGPGADPDSYAMGTMSFPGVKRLGCDVYHPLPSTADFKEKSRVIPLLLLWAFMASPRENFTFYPAFWNQSVT